jgi:hypothetical protein
VNSKFRNALSFEGGGNKIWYDAMPSHMWSEVEEHQDEQELELLAVARYEEGNLGVEHHKWAAAVKAEREKHFEIKKQYVSVPAYCLYHVPMTPHRRRFGQYYSTPMSYHRDELGYGYVGAAVASQPYNSVIVSPPPQKYYFDHHAATYATPPISPSQYNNFEYGYSHAGNPFTTMDQLDQVAALGTPIHLTPPPVHAPSPPIVRSIDSIRVKNCLLGGIYRDIFNYKREVVGRLSQKFGSKENHRCQVCFQKENSMFRIYTIRQRGVTWCQSCFEEYSISYSNVRTLYMGDEVCYHVDMLSYIRHGITYYYIPAINMAALQLGWPSVDNIKSFVAQAHIDMARRVANHSLEHRRREYRNALVDVAKKLWDGIDPCPDIAELSDGSLVDDPRPYYNDPERFRRYRERFCPTAKLPTMLFPLLDLTGIPSVQDATRKTGGWIPDPSRVTVKYHLPTPKNKRALVDLADRMLLRLTDYNDDYFYRKGCGGYVQAWVEGANRYHKNRIEADLSSGRIVRQENIPDYMKHDPMYAKLHELRAVLGLEDIHGNYVAPDVNRPKFSQRQNGEYAALMKLDAHAIAVHKEHERKIKIFNKLMASNCSHCPTGSGLFNPRGLDGMLEHMRLSHAELFWETDLFSIAG